MSAIYNVYAKDDDGSQYIVRTVTANGPQHAIEIVCDQLECNAENLSAEPQQ